MAAFGISYLAGLMKKQKNPILRFSPIIVFILLMGFFQVSHFVYAKNNWKYGNETPDPALIQSAVWLNEYDRSFVRIHSTDSPEWVGVLANKMPLNPGVSSLEAFSDEYKRQLDADDQIRKGIGEKNITRLGSLLYEWDVEYIIIREDIATGNIKKINDSEWKVYEVV
jgi:hypothetical protein